MLGSAKYLYYPTHLETHFLVVGSAYWPCGHVYSHDVVSLTAYKLYGQVVTQRLVVSSSKIFGTFSQSIRQVRVVF